MTSSRDAHNDPDYPEQDPLPSDLQRALDHLDFQRGIDQVGWKLPESDGAIRDAEARLANDPPELPLRLREAETAFSLHQSERLEEADRDVPKPIEDRARPDIEELDLRRERRDREDKDYER